jgi:restriction endonuclease
VSTNNWVNLTKLAEGEWLADASLKQRLGGESGMIRVLGKIPVRFERQKEAAKRLNKSLPTDLEMESIPLEELNRRVSDVDAELRRERHDFPTRERLFLQALQRIQGELANNVAKLGEIDKHVDKENNKLKVLENDNGLSSDDKKASRMIIEDRLNNLKDERSVRLELTSQNRKELQTQFARIKQTIEKVLDGDTSLAEGIKTIFREQGITIASILTAFGLMISTIVGFVSGGAGYNPEPEKGV